MDAIIGCCAGLDVHRDSVVACLLDGRSGGRPRREVRTFGTFRSELDQLRDWLASEGCTHVGMESTGVYWMPVYAALEELFTLIVGNAQHMKNVPGRKTDVKDSEWIADLVRHGLIRPSFVPSPAFRKLRDLTRYRRKLVNARSADRNRLLKDLEKVNIKLASVASDVFGKSGMAMLRRLAEGATDPQELAELAKGRLRRKIPELALALDGRLKDHHRLLLTLQIKRLDHADEDIADVDALIEDALAPYEAKVQLLVTIPGVDRVTAAAMLAEIGDDMSIFPTHKHLAAWSGAAPGSNESAGKRRGGKTRKGNEHLLTALVEAANAATRKKDSYLKAKFFKLKARRGHKRAIVAIGHKIIVAAYYMLSRGEPYNELGATFHDRLHEERVVSNLVHRLEALGHRVTLTPTAEAAAAQSQEAAPA